jgi:hypothetical protein
MRNGIIVRTISVTTRSRKQSQHVGEVDSRQRSFEQSVLRCAIGQVHGIEAELDDQLLHAEILRPQLLGYD